MTFHTKGEQEYGLVRNSTGSKSMLYATLFATENSTGIPQVGMGAASLTELEK